MAYIFVYVRSGVLDTVNLFDTREEAGEFQDQYAPDIPADDNAHHPDDWGIYEVSEQ